MKNVAYAAAMAALVMIGQGAAQAAKKASPPPQPTAFLKSSGQPGSSTYVSVQPGAVDGKGYNSIWWHKSEIEVPAGARIVDLNINFQLSIWEQPYRGNIPFRATLMPGHRYETTGRINGRQVDVWIADAQTGRLASKILTITAERCQNLSFLCPRPRLEVKSEL